MCPIYEYEREDGTVFEISQKITEKPLQTCPTTGQKVTKLISLTSFQLRGEGWYKTDYSGNKTKKEKDKATKKKDNKSEVIKKN